MMRAKVTISMARNQKVPLNTVPRVTVSPSAPLII